MSSPNRYVVWLPVCLLLLAGYFTFFYRLGNPPMFMWDEASYALNAQEMLETRNPIEVQLRGQPDTYNSKPPFAIWCMSVGVYLFGFNEFGVRVASAFFGFLSCVVLFGVGRRIFKNDWIALTLPLVLMSSVGFVGEHIARTGDTDSILAFWILLQSVLIGLYTEAESSSKQANRYLLFTGIAFTMGCLTKGIAGLTALPGLVVWLIYNRKLKTVLVTREFYWALIVFVLMVPGYYVLRSFLTPGYWHAVMNFEVGGRLWQQEYLNPEKLPIYHYYQQMYEPGRLYGWIVLLPMAVVAILWKATDAIRKMGLAFICMLLSVSLLLGFSQTKMFWYDAPMYPLIAGIIGILFGIAWKHNQWWGAILFVVCLVGPGYQVMVNNQKVGGTHLRECLTYVRNNGHSNDSIYIINSDPNFVVYFYSKQDLLKGRYTAVNSPNDTALKAGDYILTEKYAREVDMNQQYILDTLYRYEECSYYRIIDKK